MLKILKSLGCDHENIMIEYYEVEKLGKIAIDCSGGDMSLVLKAWQIDNVNCYIPGTDFELTMVSEPCSFDDDGEPFQWDYVGIEVA